MALISPLRNALECHGLWKLDELGLSARSAFRELSMDDFALHLIISHIISLLVLPKVPGQELHRRHSANEPAWHGMLGWQRIADALQMPKLCYLCICLQFFF